MPRIPTHLVDEAWEDPEDFDEDQPTPIGRKLPRREREEELHRRELLQKRHKEE